MSNLRTYLKAISDSPPDTRFSPEINAVIPSLVKKRWIKVIGYSDGDYVTLTERGRIALKNYFGSAGNE